MDKNINNNTTKVHVLVTGATGLIGSSIIELLSKHNKFSITAAIRRGNSKKLNKVKTIQIDDLNSNNIWKDKLENIEVVIHTAARVHVMNDKVMDPLSEFRKTNTEGTLNLARQAANAGVKRFIFISSIKVNGESTPINKPFKETDIPLPVDPYGISKYETEQGLYQISEETGMDIVCVRPTLVYGPGVKANFHSMMKLLYWSIPLPFSSIYNKRSLVALDNLTDFILTCVEHPAAANQTFLISDDDDLSTSELLTRVSRALDKKSRLINVKQNVLIFIFNILGKKNLSSRLCDSLQVDISKAKKLLSWTPVVNVDEGLKKTAEYFLNEKLK